MRGLNLKLLKDRGESRLSFFQLSVSPFSLSCLEINCFGKAFFSTVEITVIQSIHLAPIKMRKVQPSIN